VNDFVIAHEWDAFSLFESRAKNVVFEFAYSQTNPSVHRDMNDLKRFVEISGQHARFKSWRPHS
jgi:hypothetical protein